MKIIKLSGRGIVSGRAQGLAVVTAQPISFFGGLDSESGVIIERGHDLEGKKTAKTVLVFPGGKGSSVGSYVIYAMKKRGTAPTAMINVETEPIIAVGCILAEIPLIDRLNENPIKIIKTGDFVKVFGDRGIVEVNRKT